MITPQTITRSEMREMADSLWEENDDPRALEVAAIFEIAAQGHPAQALLAMKKHRDTINEKCQPYLAKGCERILCAIEVIYEESK